MSEPVDWTAVGRQMQRLSEERAAVAAKALHGPSQPAPEPTAQQSAFLSGHVRDLRSRFAAVVESFNQGVTSEPLKLIVMGPGDPKFVVVRGTLSLSFEKDATRIVQVIQRHLRKLPETQKTYAVDPEGRLTIPTGEGFLDLEQVVDLGMWEVLSTEERLPLGQPPGR